MSIISPHGVTCFIPNTRHVTDRQTDRQTTDGIAVTVANVRIVTFG